MKALYWSRWKLASLFLDYVLVSDEDDDIVFGAAFRNPQQKEDTGAETEADEGDEDHEADTLGNVGLDFWNNKNKGDAPMKVGTDVGKGPSVGNDGS
jgi:hypothetical protein